MLTDLDIILSEKDLAERVRSLADRLAPRLSGDWTIICILIGAMPFTTDLMKALAKRGIHPGLDVIWLESYGDARESSGRIVVRADIARSVAGRGVLLVDDVFDTGRTLSFARQHFQAKGAREVITCTLVRKPDAPGGEGDVDFHAFDAPQRFLVGYGMDAAGQFRGLPFLGALK